MCFSATASFAAGTALTVTGVVTLKMARDRSETPFAAIPLLFGVQQLTEGLIWLNFGGVATLPDPVLTVFYSLFSHVVWPALLPFAIAGLEDVPWRLRALTICKYIGVAVGLYLLYFIVMFPTTAVVQGAHIAYEMPHFFSIPVMTMYLIATCVSSMLSSHRLVQVFGVLSFVTFVAAYLIHAATFFSVWCFFAAILSFLVYLILHRRRTDPVILAPA
jgi:Family of unknown function (DUF6629)